VPHLVRTIRRFIQEEERTRGRASVGQRGPVAHSPEPTKSQTPVTYQVSEQPSARVQEQEFAKQLRIARYLAAANLQPARVLEPVAKARTPKQERSGTKSRSKIKAEPAKRKAGEAELAKERRRVQQVGRGKTAASGAHRGEKDRPPLRR
jgi:hypothetical protein